MLSIDPWLALIAMTIMPAMYFIGIRMRRVLFPISWITQARLADVATILDENINGVRVVKSFAQEEAEVNRLADAAERVAWAYVKDAQFRAKWSPWVQNLPRSDSPSSCSLAVDVLDGHLNIGGILAFNAYLLMLQAPFMMLGQLVMMGQRAKASAERIFEVLDENPRSPSGPRLRSHRREGRARLQSRAFRVRQRRRDPRRLRRAHPGR